MKKLSAVYPVVTNNLASLSEELNKEPATERHVSCLWGRRWSFYFEVQLTEREKRQAKNAVVQMLEADVFKITLSAVQRSFKSTGLPVTIVLLLHDGIWFTCPDDRATVAHVKEAIQEIIENSVRLSVPLTVEES